MWWRFLGIMVLGLAAWLAIKTVHAQAPFYVHSAPCLSGEASSGSYCIGGGSPPGGFHYYVANLGNDSNDCLSQATACQTLAHMQTIRYGKNDYLFVHSGDAFSECIVFDWTAGTGNVTSTFDHPLTIDIYGGTAPFTINSNCAGGTTTSTVRLEAPNGIVMRDFVLKGNGGVNARGLSFENHGTIQAVGGVDIGSFETIGYWNGSSGDFGAHAFYQGYPGGGIGTIKLHDWKCHGTSVTSSDDSCFNGYGNGINLASLEVYNLKCWDIGGRANAVNGQSGNCVEANGVVNAHIHHSVGHDIAANVTSCGGPFAFWSANTTTVLIEYVEAYHVHGTVASGCDKGGVDFDVGTVNATVQFSYLHDNDGPGLLLFDNGAGLNWHGYSNIIVSNGLVGGSTVQWQFAAATSKGALVNNLLYGLPQTSNIGSSQSNACPASWLVANNLIYGVGDSNGFNHLVYLDWIGNKANCPSQITFSHNGYWGTGYRQLWRLDSVIAQDLPTWQANAGGGDPGATLADPLLVGPLGDGTHCTDENSNTLGPQPCPAAYALQAGSTYHGAGMDPTVPPYSLQVTADYFGVAIPPFPIGASK